MSDAERLFKTIDTRTPEDDCSKKNRLESICMVVCSVINTTEESIIRRRNNNAPSAFSAAMVKQEKKQIKLLESATKLKQEIQAKDLELKNRHNKLTCSTCIYNASVRSAAKAAKAAEAAGAVTGDDVKN